MSQQKYDIIILGASGYTGQFVTEEIGRVAAENPGLKFAVAGRNKDKLEKTLDLAKGNTDLAFKDVGLIVADATNLDSLTEMARQGKVIINCVGPYRYYGDNVIAACMQGGASQVDISGEPQYLEHVQLKYSKMAEEKGLYVVGSCGFDSVPADMGTIFLRENFKGDVNSVDMVVGFQDSSQGSAAINFTTLECAVLGLSHKNELKKTRKELFAEPIPKSSHVPLPKGTIFWSDEARRWCVPNLASDRSVVVRTQHLNYHLRKVRPVQFSAYFGIKSLLSALGTVFFGLFFGAMMAFSFTRNLFLKFPEFFTLGTFSRQGPKREDLKGLKFKVTLTGHGWDTSLENPEEQHEAPPSITKTVEVLGPDPSYFATAVIVCQCALTLLQEKDKLPLRGGVYTPGAAFLETSLIKRLEKKGINFVVQ